MGIRKSQSYTPIYNSHEFSINVGAAQIDCFLINPVVLPGRLIADNYLLSYVLINELPGLLEDVPLNVRRDMWLYMNRAPPHFRIVEVVLLHGHPSHQILIP